MEQIQNNEINGLEDINIMDLEEFAIDKLKGVNALLQGLFFADDGGSHIYQKHSYDLLSSVIYDVVQYLEQLENAIVKA